MIVAEDLQSAHFGEEVRLCDGLSLTAEGGAIVVENPASGGSMTLQSDALPMLELFLGWTTPHELVHRAIDEGATANDAETTRKQRMDRAVALIHDLLKIDALVTRKEDLTGDRLPPPGAGWTEAVRFLRATRTTRGTVFAAPTEYNAELARKAVVCRQASAFMEYPEAPFIALSPPRTMPATGDRSFAEVMLTRRTARRYAPTPVSAEDLSTFLYFGWGMTRSVPNPLGDVFVRKTSPSGGSLHPVEIYPIVLNVEGTARGIYHYSVRRHGLELMREMDASNWIAHACGDQAWVAEAAVVVLCTAFLPRSSWKYDFSRVARAVMAEIGFSGQSALLAATWLGHGGFTTLALRDEIFEEIIGLDASREPVFSVVGMGCLEPELKDASRPRAESVPVEGE